MAIYLIGPDIEKLWAEARDELAKKIPASGPEASSIFADGYLEAAWHLAGEKQQEFTSIPGLSNNYDRATRDEIVRAALANHRAELKKIFTELGVSEDIAKGLADYHMDTPVFLKAQA